MTYGHDASGKHRHRRARALDAPEAVFADDSVFNSSEDRPHGCIRLLLAPHVDHLFDRGFISFDDNGDLLVSGGMEADVLAAWSIEVPRNVGVFNGDQKHFLAHHRGHVLLAG